MIEQLLTLGTNKPPPIGPGPTTLVAGTKADGYYGTLTSAELFTSSELAALVGLTNVGVALNENTRWIKAALDNKIYYYPMLPLRSNMGWGDFNSRKLVSHSQGTIVSKNGFNFKMGLFTAQNMAGATASAPVDNPSGTVTSFFNRLIYRVMAETPPGYNIAKWANFTLTDMGMQAISGNQPAGTCFICQEGSTGSWQQRNGGTGSSATNGWYSWQIGVSAVDVYRGWRPLLELVG